MALYVLHSAFSSYEVLDIYLACATFTEDIGLKVIDVLAVKDNSSVLSLRSLTFTILLEHNLNMNLGF